MNAKGAPVAVWSNGSDSIILYRPYPKEFDDTLFDIPKRGQEPKDVLEAKKTLLQLKKDFNFKKIIQDLEELVLADSGKDEFNEIFKLIFAKIWDEKEALENRRDKTVGFGKALDPDITFDLINGLFKKACEESPGIFKENEDIELAKRHLPVCVGPIEGVRLMGSNLRIMDDAFEYLLPTEANKKKGQFFTPRHVVEMCVRMLNPTQKEYVMDPSCGSGGFLLHAMEWCYPADDNDKRELRKHRYAAKYLWGVDFEARAAKTSRALMLIAGDGHTNIFGPDVSSLDPRTWFENASGQALMQGLRQAKLTGKKIPENETLKDEDKAWEYFDELKFDVILANPSFAGEMKDRKMLVHYDLAKPALKRAGDDKAPKEERDVLFIERILKMLRSGGRAAIVRDADPRCVTNQNVAVITTNSKCDPYFLTAYLQTNFGRDQLWRHSRRTEQVNLNCREVERILVPTPDISLQNEIGYLVRASFAATDNSESLYTQAQQLLESELGLDKLRFDKPVGYTARFSELELSRRFDSEHYYPGFENLKAKLPKGVGLVPLGPLLTFCQRGSSGQLELYPFDIRKFQVGEAPQPIQQEIRRLYEQATESAKQSRELLHQAKSRVEQLIEEAVRA